MMKMRMLMAAICCAGLAACAGTNGSNGLARAERSVVDDHYVSRVEAMSARNGVEVRWVNPPLKRASGKANG